MLSNLRAREHCRVIRDSRSVAYARLEVIDIVYVFNVVCMRIDVSVIGDRDVVAYLNPAAIIKKHVAMDDDVISERQVVTIGPLDKVPAFEILADTAKD